MPHNPILELLKYSIRKRILRLRKCKSNDIIEKYSPQMQKVLRESQKKMEQSDPEIEDRTLVLAVRKWIKKEEKREIIRNLQNAAKRSHQTKNRTKPRHLELRICEKSTTGPYISMEGKIYRKCKHPEVLNQNEIHPYYELIKKIRHFIQTTSYHDITPYNIKKKLENDPETQTIFSRLVVSKFDICFWDAIQHRGNLRKMRSNIRQQWSRWYYGGEETRELAVNHIMKKIEKLIESQEFEHAIVALENVVSRPPRDIDSYPWLLEAAGFYEKAASICKLIGDKERCRLYHKKAGDSYIKAIQANVPDLKSRIYRKPSKAFKFNYAFKALIQYFQAEEYQSVLMNYSSLEEIFQSYPVTSLHREFRSNLTFCIYQMSKSIINNNIGTFDTSRAKLSQIKNDLQEAILYHNKELELLIDENNQDQEKLRFEYNVETYDNIQIEINKRERIIWEHENKIEKHSNLLELINRLYITSIKRNISQEKTLAH